MTEQVYISFHMRKISLFFLLGLLFCDTNAQNNYTLDDTIQATHLLNEALQLSRESRIPEAAAKIQKVRDIYTELFEPESKQMSDVLYMEGNISFTSGNLEKGIEELNQSLNIRIKTTGEKSTWVGQAYNSLGVAYFYWDKLDQSIAHYNKALEINLFHYGDDHPDLAILRNNIGIVLSRREKFHEAIDLHQQALSVLLSKKDTFKADIGRTYGNLAATYSGMGDQSKVILYSQKALRIFRDIYGPFHPYAAIVYRNIGMAYELTSKYELAEDMYMKAISILEKNPSFQMESLGMAYGGLGLTYEKWGHLQKAVPFYEKALKEFLTIYGPSNRKVAREYEHLGNVYAQLGEYSLAEENYIQAIEIQRNLDVNHIRDLAISFRGLGIMRTLQGRFEEASQAFEESLDIQQFSGIGSLHQVRNIPHLLTTLKAYSVCSRIWYQRSLDIQHLLKAKLLVSQSIEVYSSLFKSLGKESSLDIKLHSKRVYEEALVINHLLEQHGKNEHVTLDLENFNYAERTKASLLYQSILDQDALRFAGIPDSLLKQKYTLQTDITYYEKREREALELGMSEEDSVILAYRDKIFDLTESHEVFQLEIQEDYPEYFRLAYQQDSTISVPEIQASLGKDQALLEYFLGDSSLFAFLILPDTFFVEKLHRDSSLTENIQAFLQAIYGCPPGFRIDCNQTDQTKTLFSLGHSLYQQLISPIDSLLPQRLILVPDGMLGYLPFESLLSEPVTSNNTSNRPYWLTQKTISYAFSATLWHEMKQKKHQQTPNKQLLALAPRFKETTASSPAFTSYSAFRDGYFGPLNHARQEIENIRQVMDGDLLMDSLASLENFQSNSQDYRVLHLATHGKVNEDPKYSMLAFWGPEDSVVLTDTVQHGISALYLADLYNLQLNADLVVLSACETGIGHLFEGEGIASLASGFTYAGAKSLVSSLWAVNDATTAFFMERFYFYLSKGQAKDMALRQAKLDVIQGGQSNPYYWAGFVLMGDDAPIQHMSWRWIWGLVGITVLLMFILLVKRFRKS